MADSDYDYDEDPSDEEYLGTKSSASGSRAQSALPQTSAPEKKSPQRKAWETEHSRTVEKRLDPVDDGTQWQSVQEREEARKRKRLRKDTKPFQRGIIRHVVLVLDLSEAMADKDMRPNRFFATIKYAQDYVNDFFEQNPISQMSVLGMHDGICLRISELSGNAAEHTSAIAALKSRDTGKSPEGAPSLQNALELARATLYHTPDHGTREVIIVFGSLLSLDPGDIHQTVKSCVKDKIRVSIIGMGARLKICTEIVTRTNAGDDSEYTIAVDQEMLRELLLATTTPPVIRSSTTTVKEKAPQNAAALMMMGFPNRVVEDHLTICACHGNLTLGGYECSRCSAKVCSLPVTCPGCQLTLLLSTHLARSYHHLFPLKNWKTVTWKRAREVGSTECKACLSAFNSPPAVDDGTERGEDEVPEGDEEEQKASQSGRYECRSCHSHFCVDCDVFAHMVLHNCPGCLSRLDVQENGNSNGNGDVEMSG